MCFFSSVKAYLSFLHKQARRARTARPTTPNTLPIIITCLIAEKQRPTTKKKIKTLIYISSYLFECSHVTIFEIVCVVLIFLFSLFVEQTASLGRGIGLNDVQGSLPNL